MCDETHGTHVKLINGADLSDLQVTSLFGTDVDPLSIVHNVFWQGNLLHASYYHDGYWLWQLVPGGMMQLLGFYDTSTEPHTNNYRGAWGVYPYLPSGLVLVSDMQTGLWVLDAGQATGRTEKGAPGPVMRTFPNPTADLVEVVVGPGDGLLRITDALGRIEMELRHPGGRRTVDLTGLAAGTHLFSLTTPEGRTSKWIIKQ
jgi:hypothetical protein